MEIRDHVQTTGTALKNWFIAATYDALAVGAMWFLGSLIIGIPWAPFWGLIGGAMQFIPNFGPLLAVIGPALTALFKYGDWEHLIYVLILYAIIAVVDGLLLQPYLMKRTSRVPIWASIVAPIVLGIIIPFWGVLLAPPFLAVIYAYRARRREQAVEIIPPGQLQRRGSGPDSGAK